MKLKKDGTIDKRFNPNKKVIDRQKLENLKIYWGLRKSGSPDLGGGIYMSEGMYLTKEGEIIHTR